MQTIVRYKFTGMMIWSILLLVSAGCGQHGHRKEERKIQQERVQEEKATADLSDAVKAMDTTGWDATDAYKEFSDTIRPRLAKNQQTLTDFKMKVSLGHKAVPLRYCRRIRKLIQWNNELVQRLDHCHISDKVGWEDFTTLYYHDCNRCYLV